MHQRDEFVRPIPKQTLVKVQIHGFYAFQFENKNVVKVAFNLKIAFKKKLTWRLLTAENRYKFRYDGLSIFL